MSLIQAIALVLLGFITTVSLCTFVEYMWRLLFQPWVDDIKRRERKLEQRKAAIRNTP